MEEKDYALSDKMVTYLTNFAKNGDPNGDDLPAWQPAGAKALCMGEEDPHMDKAPMGKMLRIMLTNKAVGE